MNLTNMQKYLISVILHFVDSKDTRQEVFDMVRASSGLAKAVEEVQSLWINPGRRAGKSTSAKICWKMLLEAGYPTTLVVLTHADKEKILMELGEDRDKYSPHIKALEELKKDKKSQESEPVVIFDDCGLYQHNNQIIKEMCESTKESYFSPTIVSLGEVRGRSR